MENTLPQLSSIHSVPMGGMFIKASFLELLPSVVAFMGHSTVIWSQELGEIPSGHFSFRMQPTAVYETHSSKVICD